MYNAPKSPKFNQQQYQFAAHIRDPVHNKAPEGIEDRRMGIYRDLFYNNVESLLAGTFPVLQKILSDQQWHRLIRDYYSKHQAHTPLFLEMPKEFLQYLEQEFEFQDEYPAFLGELAHYEWLELGLSIEAREIDWNGINPKGDLLAASPVLSPLAWLMAYRFPVHKLCPEYQPQTAPAQPTYLAVYRNRADEVAFMELNTVSARMLTLLSESTQLTGQQILETIAEELKHPNPEIVIQGGLQTMQQLLAKDILLGVQLN